MKLLLSKLFIFILSNFIFSQQNSNLKVEVNNIKNIQGQVIISLYNKSKDFPKKGKEYKRISVKVKANKIVHLFKDLPNGEYAVATFHDKNLDEKCNLNFLGIPKESYGFSTNYKPLFSAPSFKDTKIKLSHSKTISIKLIH